MRLYAALTAFLMALAAWARGRLLIQGAKDAAHEITEDMDRAAARSDADGAIDPYERP